MNYVNRFYFTDGDQVHPVPTEIIDEILQQDHVASFENQNGDASRYTKVGDEIVAHIFISHFIAPDQTRIPALPQVYT